MIKSFYATGDSFVFGHELHEKGEESENIHLFQFTPYKRKHCYTGIITDKLGIEDYQNTGCPGGSNERAYRNLINDISKKLKIYKPEEIFVNISLTHATRREFCFNNEGAYYIHLNAWEPPSNVSKHHHDLWEVLVKDFNYDYGHFTFDIMILLGMQNFLKANKIPYLITSSMGIEEDIQKKVLQQELLDQIYKKRYYVSPSFTAFAAANKCEIGPMLHPLEEGHALWATHLLDYINQNNLFDNSDL